MIKRILYRFAHLTLLCLQEKKVRIIAVGVGGMVEKKELTAIALGDPNHVFTVSQYKDLVQILRALLKESCMDLEGDILFFHLSVSVLGFCNIFSRGDYFKQSFGNELVVDPTN